MFKKLVHIALAAGVMALTPLHTAKAVCDMGGFGFCFTFVFNQNSSTVTFLSGSGVLTAFGIKGYGSVATPSTSSSNNFENPPASNCNAGNFGAQLCASSNNGINGGVVPPNGFVTLSFSGNASNPTNAAGFVHIQNANNSSCSLWISNTGAIVSQGENCTPLTSTPEPASVALMATGLLGLGGGLIRRRRKNS